ncbi:MAG: malonate decarboxylase holo-[acyl-carrier-protein] synthase [Luteitalea sp.]|nr:malonate decarboxylase holo-[acyl-carrier-protein] synthase [Luteitalea sp.]
MAETERSLRHAIVRVDGANWVEALTTPLDREATSLLRAWFDLGRPAVARGTTGRSPRVSVSLGVAFPPSRGRLRLAFSVGREAIRSVDPPPRLRAVIGCAPADWRQGLTRLEQEAQLKGLSFHTFGSLAWQFLTTMSYITARSDIDLLLYPRTEAALEDGVALLRTWQASQEVHADGEIVLPDGRAVAWREWDQRASLVLTKGPDGVALASRRELLGVFAS